MHPNRENIIFCLFWVKAQKPKKIVTNTSYFVLKSGEIKSRSPFHAVTDWIYCPEAPGSPRPQATGFLGLQEGTSYFNTMNSHHNIQGTIVKTEHCHTTNHEAGWNHAGEQCQSGEDSGHLPERRGDKGNHYRYSLHTLP